MKLERLKVKYVFSQERNPNKDINNTIITLANDIFPDEFYGTLLGHLSDHNEDNWTSKDLKYAIDYFIEDSLGVFLENEPEELQKLFQHPDVKEDLKEKIYHVMQ